jgi:hypothetical protein
MQLDPVTVAVLERCSKHIYNMIQVVSQHYFIRYHKRENDQEKGRWRKSKRKAGSKSRAGMELKIAHK